MKAAFAVYKKILLNTPQLAGEMKAAFAVYHRVILCHSHESGNPVLRRAQDAW